MHQHLHHRVSAACTAAHLASRSLESPDATDDDAERDGDSSSPFCGERGAGRGRERGLHDGREDRRCVSHAGTVCTSTYGRQYIYETVECSVAWGRQGKRKEAMAS